MSFFFMPISFILLCFAFFFSSAMYTTLCIGLPFNKIFASGKKNSNIRISIKKKKFKRVVAKTFYGVTTFMILH